MSAQPQYCTFELADSLFGVEVDRVQELLRQQRMTPVPLAPPEICGLINLRGQIVLAIETRRRLHMPERAPGASSMSVVIRSRYGTAALVVDSIGDVVAPDERGFEQVPDTLRGSARELIRGAYKLEGRLLLVLETDRLLGGRMSGAVADGARSHA